MADIGGKTYLYMMPYYGEIPGYTYMEVRRGAYPSGADGYAYTTDYIPNSEVSRFKLTNKLIVANEVVPPIVNFVYFSVYLPSIQEQYGQGQVAKTTPKPGDPDFMEPAEGPGMVQDNIVVTEDMVREAMKDAPLQTQQSGGVSLPVVQRYVDRILAGETNVPAIYVDNGIIVNGNHRYIASRIAGIEIDTQSWYGGSPNRVTSWDNIPIDSFDWGNN